MVDIVVDTPYLVNGTAVEKIVLRQLTFAEGVRAASRARQRGTTQSEIQKILMRENLKQQVKFYDAGGKAVAFDEAALLQMPRLLFKKVNAGGAELENIRGEVVKTGDGITSPIIYKLATPIKGADGKNIEELEFMAATLGDVEDVVYEDIKIDQSLALIRSVARPLSPDVTLLAMPDWAVEQITMGDGMAITEEVLPSFL